MCISYHCHSKPILEFIFLLYCCMWEMCDINMMNILIILRSPFIKFDIDFSLSLSLFLSFFHSFFPGGLSLTSSFQHLALKADTSPSFTCIAQGLPQPQIKWLLNNSPPNSSTQYTIQEQVSLAITSLHQQVQV